MATRKPKAQGTRTERTRSSEAGKPVTDASNASRGARSGPSDEDLDLRDRMKSGPRRPAGPPLPGDTPEPAPTRSLPDAALPPPTDPK